LGFLSHWRRENDSVPKPMIPLREEASSTEIPSFWECYLTGRWNFAVSKS
jgi:hypothetical protein